MTDNLTAMKYVQAFGEALTDLRVEMRLVTPEWASEVLAKWNDHNRSLSRTRDKIAAAIKRGAWAFTGVPVVFDRLGNLADGQHRLQAVVDCGIPVPMLVVYGVEPDAFVYFDQGKKRTTSDILSIGGDYENTRVLGGALGWQRAYMAGAIASERYDSHAVPPDAVVEMAQAHPGMAATVAYACGEGRNRLITPSLQAFLHYQFAQRDPALAESFMRKVCRGLDVAEGSHEDLLRTKLGKDDGKQRTMQDQVMTAALVIKTWNNIRGGRPAGHFVKWVRNVEPFPEIA